MRSVVAQNVGVWHMTIYKLDLLRMEKGKHGFFVCFFPADVAFAEWSAWKFAHCPRLLYSAALLHMDQAALYRAMKARRLCSSRGLRLLLLQLT